jgi:hypothetical protein
MLVVAPECLEKVEQAHLCLGVWIKLRAFPSQARKEGIQMASNPPGLPPAKPPFISYTPHIKPELMLNKASPQGYRLFYI